MSHRAEFEISILKDCEFRIVILFFSPLAEVPTLANPPRIFTGTSATVRTASSPSHLREVACVPTTATGGFSRPAAAGADPGARFAVVWH
jgi:hypothetical protein